MTITQSEQQSVRPANRGDIDPMVAIHLRAFPGFFLTNLGHRFLRELYIGILEDEASIMLVQVENENVCGFVAGTTVPASFYGRLLRQRWIRFALAAFVPAVRRPAIIVRLLRSLSKPTEERKLPGALLMSLAVDPARQRSGIGHLLVHGFCETCRFQGVHQVRLTTDQRENDSVNSFYQRYGFKIRRTLRTPEGRPMNEYVLDLH